MLAAQSSNLIGAETGIKIIAAVHSQYRCWVISGQTIAYENPPMSAIPRKRHGFSPPVCKAGSSSSVTEEYDHARRWQFPAADTQADTLEQGETDRRQATATAETCLGDSDQAPDRATNPRSGDVQSGHRQQIARLRCRRSQGRGRCSEWLFRR